MQIDITQILNQYWNDFVNTIPGVVISIIVIIIFYFVGKIFSGIIKKRLYKRSGDLLLSSFIGKITKWILLIFGLTIAMKVLGLATLAGGLLTGAGISAIIIGLAFKNIGENFLSGFLLAFNRPFKIGDLIVSSGYTGTITSMDFRTTNIKTAEGQEVFIPNSLILNNPLVNFTIDGIRRFDFALQFDYNANVEKVKEILLGSVIKVKEVLKDPAPLVIIDQLTTNVIMKIYFWIDSSKTDRSVLEIKSEVIETCKSDLSIEGVIFSDLMQIKIMNDAITVNVNSK